MKIMISSIKRFTDNVNLKNAFRLKRAGIDARKPFVLKHLGHAIPQYFYAAQIRQPKDRDRKLS